MAAMVVRRGTATHGLQATVVAAWCAAVGGTKLRGSYARPNATTGAVRTSEREYMMSYLDWKTNTVTEEGLTFAISPDWELVANVLGK